ncbi:MAG: TonB-dependent receptor, partial [Stenotrophomonas sp.]|uniref:TonB-dependent receptor domain-containing protein n=1 Tax=Stenotrophomonas sp. TaxID=69392 RepID=UPI0029A2963C
IKSTFADRRIQANIAGFYYEYTDLQVGKVINNLIGLENAATATIYGAELEIHARPVDSLRADLSFSYLNAKFDEYISADNFRPAGDGVTVDPVTGAPAFNLAGNTIPQAPEFTIFAGAEYLMEVPFGTFSLRGEVLWTDRVYFSAFNRTNVSQPSRTILNAFLNFADD